MAKDTVSRDFIITDARLSYADLFKAKVFDNGSGQKQEPKFGATALLDITTQKDQIRNIFNLLAEIKAEAFPGYKAALAHMPLRDGSEKPDTEGYGEGIKFIRASSTRRPIVVGRLKQPVAEGDREAPYSGCFVDMKVQFWSQVFMGKRQINTSLVAVRFLRDGEAFSGVSFNVDEFRDLDNAESAGDGDTVDQFTL